MSARGSVLVVRPQRAPDAFVQSLEERGWRVHPLPVMVIEPLPENDNAIKSVILDFDHFQKAVVVSANAARLALDWLNTYWPQLPVGVSFFAVGRSSAQVLERQHVPVRFPRDNPTSEGLLALPEMTDVSGQRIVIFRGQGGRDRLRRELEEQGAHVRYCDLYRRVADDRHGLEIRQLLTAGELDAVAVHSGELLEALLAVLDDEAFAALAQTPVLVPGDRVAAMAREAGLGRVVVAEGALPETMVEALSRCYTGG